MRATTHTEKTTSRMQKNAPAPTSLWTAARRWTHAKTNRCTIRNMAEQTLGDTMSAIAILHADRVRHGRLWEVEFDGEMVVIGSRDPEFDLARVLLARGCTGKVTILDGKTGGRRAIIPDIEKAAGLRTEEGPYGPRFVKWRQTSVDHSYTGEIALAGTLSRPPLGEQAERLLYYGRGEM